MNNRSLAVVLTLALCSVGEAGWVFPGCTLDPANPTSADEITFTFGGIWGDTCIPDALSVQIVGSTILVDVLYLERPTFCGDSPTPWTLSETIGPLSPGTYTVLGTFHYFEEPLPEHVDTEICEIVVSDAGAACTPVGGVICQDTTWTAGGGPYCVTSSIVVGCGATLTVEPGVHVCFPRGLFGLAVGSGAFGEGTLVARGTSEAPIMFTSCEPDAAPGDWVSINFTSFATSAVFDEDDEYVSGSILEHVIVQYAGGDVTEGAVIVNDSSPYLSHSTLRHNTSRGIFVRNVGDNEHPIRIENCKISGNSTTGSGGGIFLDESPSATLVGNTINGNTGGAGGGIFLYESPSATLLGNTIIDNSVEFSAGGGILFAFSPSATLTGNTISGNSAGGSGGGGIYFRNSGFATLTGNTISGNSNLSEGGGIFLDESPSTTLTDNNISGNWAGAGGGGIYFTISPSATLTRNSISVNSTSGYGGGISLVESAFATLSGNIFVSNVAVQQAGAMYVSSSRDVTLTDSVFAGNVSSGTGGLLVIGSSGLLLNLNGSPPVSLLSNRPFDVSNINDFGPAENEIDARNIWWGTQSTDEIEDRVWDFFDDASRAFVVWDPPAATGPFDFNGDGEILRDDLTGMVACLGGPDEPIEESCALGDLDRNGIVDLFDFATFQTVVRAP